MLEYKGDYLAKGKLESTIKYKKYHEYRNLGFLYMQGWEDQLWQDIGICKLSLLLLLFVCI